MVIHVLLPSLPYSPDYDDNDGLEKDGIALDCDQIPTCRMSCAGPNEELLRIVTTHAGCMVEWYFHASTVKLGATLLMFLFLNISRVVLVGGIVKLNWR